MPLTREQARSLDRRAMEEFAVPGGVLMENAGRGMAELLHALGIRGRVVVCCGRGNNGGDGFVLARHLDNARFEVRVLLFGAVEELAGDAMVNYTILERSGLSLKSFSGKTLDESSLRTELAGADWVVDALFGSGLQGPVRPPFDRVIEAINSSGARIFAVDIPSGLDSDTGAPMGPTVRAQHTATVVASKRGFEAPGAREWPGQVHTIDMGAPRRLIEEALAGG